MSERHVRRFVADLICRRRPRSFAAGPDEAAELRAAIMLRSAAPGAGEPSEEFVAGLRERLEAALSTADDPAPPPNRRRMITQTSSVAAASAAIGAVAGIVLRGNDNPETLATQPQLLEPESGDWLPVAASTDLPEGGIQPFDLGTVVGFVQRRNGTVLAVSGVCTHLGCRLGLDTPNRRLNCPCHRTSFTPNGEVIAHQLPVSPPPLPHLPVRETNGMIQIFAPPSA